MLAAALALLVAGTATTATAATGGRAVTSNAHVVVGADGYLFSAQDWTVPCQDAARTADVVQAMRDIARELQAGGRTAVVTIGPDKSTVMTQDLPAQLPVADCHATQHETLWSGATQAPQFLDLRGPLQDAAGGGRQVYYRKDTHFAHNGDEVYSRELARKLDPLLPLALSRTTTTGTVRGDLASVLGVPPYETVSGLSLANRVTVTELPEQNIGLTVPMKHFVATPKLGGQVLPGRTVFVGDSFTAVAMHDLAQLSQETLFLWTDSRAPLQPMLDEMARGDRVVIESVERLTTRFRMWRPDVVQGVASLPPRTGLPGLPGGRG